MMKPLILSVGLISLMEIISSFALIHKHGRWKHIFHSRSSSLIPSSRQLSRAVAGNP